MTSGQRSEYAQAVWSAFKAKSVGDPRLTLDLMSSSEWHILAGWMDRDLPLRVVLRAFEDTGGKAKSPLYFEKPVEQAYRHWLEAIG